jgi:hypothetical protein
MKPAETSVRCVRKPAALGVRVSRRTLRGGLQDGVKVIEIDNGRLALQVSPTRGMGILSAQCDHQTLGWKSPLGIVVHPRHVHLRRNGGTGWLDGFTEFVVRCGVGSLGPPGWDTVPTAQGVRREFLTLHGRSANTAAQAVKVRREAGQVEVSGRVADATRNGILEVATSISTRHNTPGFRLVEVVTNRGADLAEFQVLYHTNFGAPILGEGTRFLAAIDSVAGRDAHSTRGIATFDRFRAPTAGFQEQVYLIWLRGDACGRTLVAIENAAGNVAVSLAFSLRELPCMTLWKQTGAGRERYVAGLEPGTNYPNHRSIERECGRVMTLAPGQSHRMTIDYRVHVGAQRISLLRERIRRLQGGTPRLILPLNQFNARGRLF